MLVNNAGTVDIGPLEDTSLSTWERLIAVNMTGPYLVTNEALPALRESERAHVFNVAALMAKEPRTERVPVRRDEGGARRVVGRDA